MKKVLIIGTQDESRGNTFNIARSKNLLTTENEELDYMDVPINSPREEGEAVSEEDDVDSYQGHKKVDPSDPKLEEEYRRILAERHARRQNDSPYRNLDSYEKSSEKEYRDKGKKRKHSSKKNRSTPPTSPFGRESPRSLSPSKDKMNPTKRINTNPSNEKNSGISSQAAQKSEPKHNKELANAINSLGVDSSAIQLPDSPLKSDVEDEVDIPYHTKLGQLREEVEEKRLNLLKQSAMKKSMMRMNINEDEDNLLDESDNESLKENEDREPFKPYYYPSTQGCRSVEEFECLNRIEEGTYGVVYRARDKKTNEIMALKRLKMEKERDGFPITSLREISTLMKAQHENIVTVREVVVGSNMDKIYLVMEYVEHDLKSLMNTMNGSFSVGEVKCLLLQLLRAVNHLHDNWILHRDLKTSNLLLSHKGILKVGDFGLAREYGSPLRPYTEVVVTLWYRAPELLLGVESYTCPIDMWSVGCIFAEFLLQRPLFPGKSELDQLNIIFKDLGTPNERIWPGVSNLPGLKKCVFTEYPFNQLRRRFTERQITDTGFDLLNALLAYCPDKRMTASKALDHNYFNERPRAIDPSVFPSWPAKSEGSIVKKKVSPRLTANAKNSEDALYRAAGIIPQPPPPSGGARFFGKTGAMISPSGTGGNSHSESREPQSSEQKFVLKF